MSYVTRILLIIFAAIEMVAHQHTSLGLVWAVITGAATMQLIYCIIEDVSE